MSRFSERYGYIQPSSVLIREELTEEIINAVCNAYDLLNQRDSLLYRKIEEHLWLYFLNKRLTDFYGQYGGYSVVATEYIKHPKIKWYKKLDLI
jgi:hypothetical protein